MRRRWTASPLWPPLLSGLVAPGLGQIVNREYRKGIILLITTVTSLFWFIRIVTARLDQVLPGSPETWARNSAAMQEAMTALVNENPDMFLTFHGLMLALWIFGVVDAYISAKRPAP